MTKVLLNASAGELEHLGGDYTYYRDLLGLSGPRMRFETLTGGRRREASTLARRAAMKAVRNGQPDGLRRWLFLQSRLALVPRSEIAVRKPDVLFSHVWFPRLGPSPTPPIVWSTQGISPAAYYRYVSRGRITWDDVVALYRVLGSRAARLLVWTRACADNVASACPELTDKLTVLHPPIAGPVGELPPKPSTSDGVVRLLFIGVDAERKGLPEVLRAVSLLQSTSPETPFELVVVSRPPEELVARMRAMPAVRFLRSSPGLDLGPLFGDADVLLVPTHADTYASTAVEAMSYGCAVIISDLPPLPEVVPEGVAGFAVPAGADTVLADRVRCLAGDNDRLRSMQAGARQLYLARNAPEVFASELERLFDAVLARGGASPSF